MDKHKVVLVNTFYADIDDIRKIDTLEEGSVVALNPFAHEVLADNNVSHHIMDDFINQNELDEKLFRIWGCTEAVIKKAVLRLEDCEIYPLEAMSFPIISLITYMYRYFFLVKNISPGLKKHWKVIEEHKQTPELDNEILRYFFSDKGSLYRAIFGDAVDLNFIEGLEPKTLVVRDEAIKYIKKVVKRVLKYAERIKSYGKISGRRILIAGGYSESMRMLEKMVNGVHFEYINPMHMKGQPDEVGRYQEMKGKIVGEWEPMLREFLRKEFTKQICEYVIEKIKTALPIIFRDLENLRAYFKHLRQENISAIIATSPIKNIHEMDLFYQLARNKYKYYYYHYMPGMGARDCEKDLFYDRILTAYATILCYGDGYREYLLNNGMTNAITVGSLKHARLIGNGAGSSE